MKPDKHSAERKPFVGQGERTIRRRRHLLLLGCHGEGDRPRLLGLCRLEDADALVEIIAHYDHIAKDRKDPPGDALEMRVTECQDGFQDLSWAWARGKYAPQWVDQVRAAFAKDRPSTLEKLPLPDHVEAAFAGGSPLDTEQMLGRDRG